MHETPKSVTDPAINPPHYHAVVWLDHEQARIIHFSMIAVGERGKDKAVVRPADPPRHLHIKARVASGTHITREPAFYRDVEQGCDGCRALLVAGPTTAKGEFMTYLRKHSPQLAARILGVETVAAITEHQLLAEGRRFFAKTDRMTPQA